MSQKELRKRLEGTVQVQHQQLKMGFLADLGGHVAKHVSLIRRNRSSWILQITRRKIVWCYTCCVISLFFLLSWGDYLWTRSAEALGVCIERKTMRDLIGRSAKGDHLRQLRRLSASRLPSALLLEGDISTAPRQVAYGADPIAPSHSDTALRESLDVLCLLARQGRWSRQIHQILSTCNTIPVSQTSSYQKDMSIILVVGLGFPSKDPKKLVHKLPQPATTLMRLLLERRCFVLLTFNATDTATCLASWSSVIKDMSCCPKVPLDALKKAPESSDRDHSDLLACVHAAGLLKSGSHWQAVLFSGWAASCVPKMSRCPKAATASGTIAPSSDGCRFTGRSLGQQPCSSEHFLRAVSGCNCAIRGLKINWSCKRAWGATLFESHNRNQ